MASDRSAGRLYVAVMTLTRPGTSMPLRRERSLAVNQVFWTLNRTTRAARRTVGTTPRREALTSTPPSSFARDAGALRSPPSGSQTTRPRPRSRPASLTLVVPRSAVLARTLPRRYGTRVQRIHSSLMTGHQNNPSIRDRNSGAE
jgi:hypothetical protein